MDKIIVGIGGILSIIFVIWFFFGKKQRVSKALEVAGVQEVEVIVDGGYSPDVIQVKRDVPLRLYFYRKDPSSCLEEIIIGDFNIRKKLVLNQRTLIEFTPQRSGEYDFSCGMGMFHGKLIVK